MSDSEIRAAQRLINEGDYDGARGILIHLDDPRAAAMLQRIDGLGKGKKRDDYYGGYDAPPRDYLPISVGVLLLYFAAWVPGILANLYFLGHMRRSRREGFPIRNGGCLWGLFGVFGCATALGIAGFILFFVVTSVVSVVPQVIPDMPIIQGEGFGDLDELELNFGDSDD